MWEEGDWSNTGPGVVKRPKSELFLEPKMLTELRDWLDQRLELLGNELESLAASHGLP